MLISERVLGPKWSQKELRTFFILLKAHGKSWERFAERLPLRTTSMVRALYDMHRGYLSLPEASPDGFCTIMMDHYKAIEELKSSSNKRRTRSSTEDSLTQSPNQCSIEEDTVQSPISGKDDSLKKKRRLDAILSSHTRVETTNGEMCLSHSPPRKNLSPDKQKKKKMHKKKMQQPAHARSCLSHDPSLSSCLKGKKFDLPWYYWLYSHLDRSFFEHNEFVDCLHRMGLGKITKASRPIWSSVRASMGHPRRLSPYFLTQERQKLDTYRSIARNTISQKPPEEWPFGIIRPVAVGSQVIVRLTMPQLSFAIGSVSTCNLEDGTCTVRLNGSETNGAQDVLIDFDSLMPVVSFTNKNKLSVSHIQEKNKIEIDLKQEKVKTMILVKDLLKRKEKILFALSKMNQDAEKRNFTHENEDLPFVLKDENKMTQNDAAIIQFQREYAWLIVNLDLTNKYLHAALLRLQDLNNEYENFSTLDEQSSLNIEEMRWAVDFLHASQQFSSQLFSETMTSTFTANRKPLKKQMESLIQHCLSLASVISGQKEGDAKTIPRVISTKLVDRFLELLIPVHPENMDLYNEILGALEEFRVPTQK